MCYSLCMAAPISSGAANAFRPSQRISEPRDYFQLRELYNSTHLGGLCVRIIYDQMPATWFSVSPLMWPSAYPQEWFSTLKASILADPYLQQSIREEMLDNGALHFLTNLVVQQLKELFSRDEVREAVSSNKEIDVARIVRLNLETNPWLDSLHFASVLHPFIQQLSKNPVDWWDIHSRTKFYQSLCSKCPDSVHSADEIFLFLSELLPCTVQESYCQFFSVNLLSECAALDEIKRAMTDEEKPSDDGSNLSELLCYLYELSEEWGDKNLFFSLKKKLLHYIKNYNSDNRQIQDVELSRHLLEESKPLLGALFTPFGDEPILQKAFEIFEGLSPLTTHEAAINALQKELEISFHFAKLLYRGCWYEYCFRDDESISPIDRLIDWVVNDFLCRDGEWAVERMGAIEMVRDRFRQEYPYMPFDLRRADITWHKLQHARSLQIENETQSAKE